MKIIRRSFLKSVVRQYAHPRAGVFNVFRALLCQPDEDPFQNNEVFDSLKVALNHVNPTCSDTAGRMQEAVIQSSCRI